MLGVLLLLACAAFSIAYGLMDIRLSTIYEALTGFNASPEHYIVRTVRLPRALIAATVGAALAVAGAIMQALTRNPLAAPGVLGINAGASLAVVAAMFLLNTASLSVYAWFAFLGAALAAVLVYSLGSLGRGGMTPLKLTVAGAALTALFSSITQGLMVLNERTLDEMRFWMAGSVAGRDMTLFLQVLPFLGAGLLGAFVMGKQITTLSLGEDVARGLGQRTGWIKAGAALIVVLLAGSAVAVAGPISFIGLAVPHIARKIVGTDYRWILPLSAVLGGILLLLADIGARAVLRPQEVAVGIMTALLGAPFFIALARQGVKKT
ncbi:MAG: ABC-type Fe3+-siderophore transport system, permease component [Symbiobacteriaceae bacterium]|jgi:iron complex transport system permease protein|nr:ABC-type Fe3+-siderophore transport system, permease component [Symbiobacteriaceae bacterium]